MIVTTGFGYLKDADGNIVTKIELPPGNHPLKDGYVFFEVSSKSELDSVKTYVPPTPPKSDEVKLEELINNKIREIAIAELKKEGKLTEQGGLNVDKG
jgi:hypothetical protein